MVSAGRQALEVGQGRKAGAKVVQCKTHAQGLAALHHAAHVLHVFQRSRFQNLQLQSCGRHLGAGVQDVLEPLHKVGPVKVGRRDVDADFPAHARIAPRPHLCQGLAQSVMASAFAKLQQTKNR